jgi:hypothetical protein
VRRAPVERLFELFRRTGRQGYLEQLWTLVVLELWAKQVHGQAAA